MDPLLLLGNVGGSYIDGRQPKMVSFYYIERRFMTTGTLLSDQIRTTLCTFSPCQSVELYFLLHPLVALWSFYMRLEMLL